MLKERIWEQAIFGDPRGRPYYWINGPLIEDAEEGTDVHAIRKGNISITPITLDCTALSATDELKGLFCGDWV